MGKGINGIQRKSESTDRNRFSREPEPSPSSAPARERGVSIVSSCQSVRSPEFIAEKFIDAVAGSDPVRFTLVDAEGKKPLVGTFDSLSAQLLEHWNSGGRITVRLPKGCLLIRLKPGCELDPNTIPRCFIRNSETTAIYGVWLGVDDAFVSLIDGEVTRVKSIPLPGLSPIEVYEPGPIVPANPLPASLSNALLAVAAEYPIKSPQAKLATKPLVERFLAESGASFDVASGAIRLRYRGKDRKLTDVGLQEFLYTEFESARSFYSVVPKDMTAIRASINQWIEGQIEAAIDRVRASVAFDPSTSQDESLKFIKAVCGDRRLEINRAVFEHFIWQTKRKLNSLPVTDHMMPLFYGRQGAGKTTAILKALAPLSGFYNLLDDLTRLSDKRELQLLARNFVLFVDEAGRAEKAEVDLLKHYLSASTLNQRQMKTLNHSTDEVRATLIGASNRQLIDLISDPSGMRRFFQLDCLDKLDWSNINGGIDYAALWRAIDESKPSPIAPHLSEVRRIQDTEFRTRDSVELFIDDECDRKPEDDEWESAGDLYSRYRQYCDTSGIKSCLNRQRFCSRLKELGIACKKSSTIKYALKEKPHPSVGV